MKKYISCVLIALCACSTSPTGRTQLHMLDDGQMNDMGVQSFDEIKKKEKISQDPKLTAHVRCVVNTLLQRNDFNPSQWEIQVFQNEAVNAFALPGHKIGVYTGIFKTAKNQSQLAAVLGHEIGHVIANHGNERVSQGLLTQGLMSAIEKKVDANSNSGKAIMVGLGLGANIGILMPYSRKHESEADELGVKYMSIAGFDPTQAKELWINMAALGDGAPEILSTHPDSKRRAHDIETKLDQALDLQRSSLSRFAAPKCY